jgi:chitin-binding protein
MTVRRKLAVTAAVGVAPLLLMAVAAAPAAAHGALQNPLSRAVACGSEGGHSARSEACRAAIAASGAQASEQWDELRVANIAGRDRELIPDGKLCSAGIDEFKGFDLPRPDWPATKLSGGAEFTFKYRSTIGHTGTFRLYVTKDGYDPSQPLRWSALESEPFVTATDPVLDNGFYTFAGRLPTGKTGRHLIYTIWQNSSTPDTYYSCSDVAFGGGTGTGSGASSGSGSGGGNGGGSDSGTGVAAPPGSAPAALPAPGDASSGAVPTADGESRALPLAAGGVALLVAAGVTVATVRRRRS